MYTILYSLGLVQASWRNLMFPKSSNVAKANRKKKKLPLNHHKNVFVVRHVYLTTCLHLPLSGRRTKREYTLHTQYHSLTCPNAVLNTDVQIAIMIFFLCIYQDCRHQKKRLHVCIWAYIWNVTGWVLVQARSWLTCITITIHILVSTLEDNGKSLTLLWWLWRVESSQ